jgi:hypothetical protein
MYQSEAGAPPGKVALTPVTWAPDGRVRLAQAPGPQLTFGVTAVPACHTPLAFRQAMVTEAGSTTP